MKTRTVIYSRFWRVLASVLVVVSRTSPLVLLGLLWFSSDPPANPLRLMRLFSSFCLAPGLLAWLVKQAFAASLDVANVTLVLEQRQRRIEIPCDAITAVEPWTIPLPGPGLWLRLPSGRRFQYGIHVENPALLIEAAADAGAPAAVRECIASGAVVYARAKHAAGQWRWYHLLLKYVLFGLVPTLPLFRVHQWIAYGGTFGEYYQYGLKAYALGFVVYWGTLIVYLAMWAAPWRGVAEVIAYGTAFVAPSQAAWVRRAVEVGHRVIYYGGVPVILLLRFFG